MGVPLPPPPRDEPSVAYAQTTAILAVVGVVSHAALTAWRIWSTNPALRLWQ